MDPKRTFPEPAVKIRCFGVLMVLRIVKSKQGTLLHTNARQRDEKLGTYRTYCQSSLEFLLYCLKDYRSNLRGQR
jgi:hypothetical protein